MNSGGGSDGLNWTTYDYSLLNSPRWFIIGGYNESWYHFSIGGQGNLNTKAYVGLHVLDFTLSAHVDGKLVSSAVQI